MLFALERVQKTRPATTFYSLNEAQVPQNVQSDTPTLELTIPPGELTGCRTPRKRSKMIHVRFAINDKPQSFYRLRNLLTIINNNISISSSNAQILTDASKTSTGVYNHKQ